MLNIDHKNSRFKSNKSNKSIKLNGIPNYVFKDWSNVTSCSPLLYFEPDSVEQLKEILRLADTNNKKLKIVGEGHSWSGD